MFTFAYRFSLRLCWVITLSVVGFMLIQRGVQAAYPPILYSEISNLSLYTMTVGCSSAWVSCKRSERLLLEGMYSLPVAEWSPNGRYIAAHLSDGWLIYPTECLLVIKTCDPVPVIPAVQDNRLAWGPDGTTLASYVSTNIVTATIQTSGCWQADSPCLEKKIALSDFYALTELAWSADGSRMAFSDFVQTGLVWLNTYCFDNPDGCSADLHTIPVGLNRISWPSLSPDGRSVLLMMDTSGNGTSMQLFIVDLESGQKRQVTERSGTAQFPDWSADERYILFSGLASAGSGDLQIYLMDMDRHITLPLVTHKGRDLAFASWGYVPQ
jgi:hypothetical protein